MAELLKLIKYLSNSSKEIIMTFLLSYRIRVPKYIKLTIIGHLNLVFDDNLIKFDDMTLVEFSRYISYISEPNFILLLLMICRDKNYILYKEVLSCIPVMPDKLLSTGLYNICKFGTVKYVHKYVKHFVDCGIKYATGLEGMCENSEFFKEGFDRYICSTSKKTYPINSNILWLDGLVGAYRANNSKVIELIINKMKTLGEEIDWDYALLGIFTSNDLESRIDTIDNIIDSYSNKNIINWQWIYGHTYAYHFNNIKILLQYMLKFSIHENGNIIVNSISICSLNAGLSRACQYDMADLAEFYIKIYADLHCNNCNNLKHYI